MDPSTALRASGRPWVLKSGRVLVFCLLTAVMALAGCVESPPFPIPTTIIGISSPLPFATIKPTITRNPVSNQKPVYETPNPLPMFETLIPTTPLPSQTLNPTLIYQSEYATQQTKATSGTSFDTRCDGLFIDPGFISPDSTWVGCWNYQTIMLVNRDGIRLDVPIAEKYGVDGFPGEFAPLFWAEDDQYVYIQAYALVDGGFGYGSTRAVWRISLVDGSVSEILKPGVIYTGYPGKFYAASISPTGRRLVYAPQYETPLFLTIIDLSTGESENIGLRNDFLWAGSFHWSPDGTKLVFELASSPTDMDSFEPAYFALIYFDFEDSSSSVFADHLEEDFINVDVDNTSAIYKDSNNISWKFNFQNHNLSLIGTLTPTPTP